MAWIGESSLDKYNYNKEKTMALKQTGRKQYKTMQGKAIDMDLLRQKNELTPAVGNARVNARGDEIGPGGKIVKKREDVLRDFYDDNIQPVPDDAPVKVKEEVQETASVVDDAPVKKTTTRKAGQTKAEAKVEDEWVEDADGNFVRKGD
jgi:hypothetical protein